jgi:type I restriction enzyme S subunit
MLDRKIKISEICELDRENISSNDNFEFINYLDTGNITENRINEIKFLKKGKDDFPSRAKRKVKSGTIIYSTVRPNQKHYGYIDNPIKNMIVSTGFTTIDVLDNKVDSKFIYYALINEPITNYLQMITDNSVSSYPSINPSDIGNLKIKIPSSKPTQQKIAAVLSALDAKIELNKKINSELETMAKTIYDYWFVQFDFPDENNKPYKSSGGKMVYNKKLKREIPQGWKVEPIVDICEIVDCLHSKKPDCCFENEKYYLLQLENILDNGLIDLNKKYYVSQKDYENWTSRIEVKDNDLIITNAGRVAAVAQIPKNTITGIGRNITAIRPKSINPTYLFSSFFGLDIKQQILWNTDQGSFFQSFNVKGIKNLFIVRSANNIENIFESIVFPIRRKRELVQQENQQLSELRDWLLPMLMNGQVKVK